MQYWACNTVTGNVTVTQLRKSNLSLVKFEFLTHKFYLFNGLWYMSNIISLTLTLLKKFNTHESWTSITITSYYWCLVGVIVCQMNREVAV